MSRQGRVRRIGPVAEEEAGLRPLYARVLRLRHLNPGGMLCFLFLEGAVALGLLLALAELVSWWGLLVLPMAVAVMVKANDLVAGAAARSAALVPEQERDRFRREVVPAVGRAIVPGRLGRGAARVCQPVTDEGNVSQAAAPQAPYVGVPEMSATGVPVVVDGAIVYPPPKAGWAQPRGAPPGARAVAFPGSGAWPGPTVT